MVGLNKLRIGISGEDSGAEFVADAGRTVKIADGHGVIGVVQVVVIGDEIPTQTIVDGKGWPDVEGVLSKDAKGLGKFVEIVRTGGGKGCRFGVIGP